MRKVLHLITGLERGGGAENMLLKTLPYLEKSENAVCVLKDTGEIGRELVNKGIKVYPLGIKMPWDVFVGVWRYRKVIKDIKPDIQVNYLIHADIFGRIFAKLFGVKILIAYIRNRHIKPLFVFLDKMTMGRVDHLLANSESVLEYYQKNYSVSKERSGVIVNGVDIDKKIPAFDHDQFRKNIGLSKNEKIIVCVASFSRQKDHPTILKAIKILKDRRIFGFRLLLVGQGAKRKELEDLMLEFDIEDQVIFLGKRKDVDKILAISTSFVLASIHEGMSNALLEAMASGVPAIVSSIPENEELVRHNENGLVFNVGDADSLAESLISALEDREKMEKFGQAARKTVEEKYDIKKIIYLLDEFLAER